MLWHAYDMFCSLSHLNKVLWISASPVLHSAIWLFFFRNINMPPLCIELLNHSRMFPDDWKGCDLWLLIVAFGGWGMEGVEAQWTAVRKRKETVRRTKHLEKQFKPKPNSCPGSNAESERAAPWRFKTIPPWSPGAVTPNDLRPSRVCAALKQDVLDLVPNQRRTRHKSGTRAAFMFETSFPLRRSERENNMVFGCGCPGGC